VQRSADLSRVFFPGSPGLTAVRRPLSFFTHYCNILKIS
jgi:hypothetical protein